MVLETARSHRIRSTSTYVLDINDRVYLGSLATGRTSMVSVDILFGTFSSIEEGLAILVTELKAQVQRILAREFPGLPASRRSDLKFTLQLAHDHRFEREGGMTLGDIQLSTFMNLLERSLQSEGVVVTSNDITVSTHFPRAMYNVGGSGSALQSWFPKQMKKNLSVKSHEDAQGPISCMAVALAFNILQATGKLGKQTVARNNARILRRARELQTEMGWGQYTDTSALEEFVTKYPQYRVVFFNIAKKSKAIVYADPTYRQIENPKTMFVYLGNNGKTGHWMVVPNPTMFLRLRDGTGNSGRFCDECFEYYQAHVSHSCPGSLPPRAQPPYCRYCHTAGHPTGLCGVAPCKQCHTAFERGTKHRCGLMSPNFKNGECFDNEKWKTAPFQHDGCTDGKIPALLVWDIESQLDIIERKESTLAEMDPEGYCTGDTVVGIVSVRAHKPTMICVANCYSDETWTFDGYSCVMDMFNFLRSYNKGKCILLAHNAAKYDNRLLFDALCANEDIAPDLHLTTRGTKFLQISYNHDLVFRDSLLHITGSLKSLAVAYSLAPDMQKGYFPHLFNVEANYNYVGPKPAREYFDVPDCKAFNDWYAELPAEWSMRREMEKYCTQDVRVLREIVRLHCLQSREINQPLVRSPWQYTTTPAYVHDVIRLGYNQAIEDEVQARNHNGDVVSANQIREEIVNDRGWPVLLDEEYYFARRALHGGRTNLARAYYNAAENGGKLGSVY